MRIASVGALIYNDQELKVGTGKPGERVRALRTALNELQWGERADDFGWLRFIA